MLGLKGKYMRVCKDLVSGDKSLKIQKKRKYSKSNMLHSKNENTHFIKYSQQYVFFFLILFLKAIFEFIVR